MVTASRAELACTVAIPGTPLLSAMSRSSGIDYYLAMGRHGAAIYCRISKDKESEELGVQRQEEDCRRLADRLGFDVVAVHVDNDISASTRSQKRRPAYEDMLRSAEAGDLDVLLAYSTSRLTRRPLEYERLITLVEKHKTAIETVVSGRVDLTTADGRFIARTLANADAAEAERTAERVARAAQQRREKGEWHGGHAPYGYRLKARAATGGSGGLVIEPREANLVRDLASRLPDGETLYGVVTDLNKRKIPTARGAQWYSRTLKRALLTPALKGCNSGGQRGAWEPVLDDDTWERLSSS